MIRGNLALQALKNFKVDFSKNIIPCSYEKTFFDTFLL